MQRPNHRTRKLSGPNPITKSWGQLPLVKCETLPAPSTDKPLKRLTITTAPALG